MGRFINWMVYDSEPTPTKVPGVRVRLYHPWVLSRLYPGPPWKRPHVCRRRLTPQEDYGKEWWEFTNLKPGVYHITTDQRRHLPELQWIVNESGEYEDIDYVREEIPYLGRWSNYHSWTNMATARYVYRLFGRDVDRELEDYSERYKQVETEYGSSSRPKEDDTRNKGSIFDKSNLHENRIHALVYAKTLLSRDKLSEVTKDKLVAAFETLLTLSDNFWLENPLISPERALKRAEQIYFCRLGAKVARSAFADYVEECNAKSTDSD